MVINNYNYNSSKSIASFLSRKPKPECSEVLTARQTAQASCDVLPNSQERTVYGGSGTLFSDTLGLSSEMSYSRLTHAGQATETAYEVIA